MPRWPPARLLVRLLLSTQQCQRRLPGCFQRFPASSGLTSTLAVIAALHRAAFYLAQASTAMRCRAARRAAAPCIAGHLSAAALHCCADEQQARDLGHRPEKRTRISACRSAADHYNRNPLLTSAQHQTRMPVALARLRRRHRTCTIGAHPITDP